MKKYRKYLFLILSIVVMSITLIIGKSDSKPIDTVFRSEEALCSGESGLDICKGSGGFCLIENMPWIGIHYKK